MEEADTTNPRTPTGDKNGKFWHAIQSLSLRRSDVTHQGISFHSSYRAHILEYSLSIAPVVSLGHISTDALAAVTLGTMTASVTGFSLIIGMSTAMDTMLPPAWTSGTPSHVGLWTIRMAILMTLLLVVSIQLESAL